MVVDPNTGEVFDDAYDQLNDAASKLLDSCSSITDATNAYLWNERVREEFLRRVDALNEVVNNH